MQRDGANSNWTVYCSDLALFARLPYRALLEELRMPADHHIHELRVLVDKLLRELDTTLARRRTEMGRPSITPQRLLLASLLQLGKGGSCNSGGRQIGRCGRMQGSGWHLPFARLRFEEGVGRRRNGRYGNRHHHPSHHEPQARLPPCPLGRLYRVWRSLALGTRRRRRRRKSRACSLKTERAICGNGYLPTSTAVPSPLLCQGTGGEKQWLRASGRTWWAHVPRSSFTCLFLPFVSESAPMLCAHSPMSFQPSALRSS